MTFRIQRSKSSEAIVFALSGELDNEHMESLNELLEDEKRSILLDLEMSRSLGGMPWSFWRASRQQVFDSLTARDMFARGSMRKTMVNDGDAVGTLYRSWRWTFWVGRYGRRS